MEFAPWVLALGLLAAVGHANRHAINHDAVSYVFLAKHYLNGDLALAVSGLWSPLFVWLLAALHSFIADPMIAARVAMVVSGVVFMVGARALAAFLPDPLLRLSMMVVSALFSAIASGIQITPDLLSAGVYAWACARLLAADGSPRNMLSVGVAFGGAYLAKAVLLPIAVIVIPIHFGLLAIGRSVTVRQALAAVAIAYAAMFLIVLPWVAVLSAKYGYLTFSNVHAHQHASIGPPGIAEDLATNRMFVVPELGRQSQFEDETIFPSATWSPLDSPAHLVHFIRYVVGRTPKVLEAARATDLLGIGLVFGLVLFVWHVARSAKASRLGLLAPAMVLPILAYLPSYAIHVRLFFVCAPLYFVCAFGGASAIARTIGARRLGPWLAAGAFVALVGSSLSLLPLQSFVGWETEWYRRSRAMAPILRQVGAVGPVAVAGMERDKHFAVYLSYALGTAYHGISNDNSVAQILQSCARLIVARAGSAHDIAMRAAPERFEPLSDRVPSIGRLLADANLLLFAANTSGESAVDHCRGPTPLWRIPAFGIIQSLSAPTRSSE